MNETAIYAKKLSIPLTYLHMPIVGNWQREEKLGSAKSRSYFFHFSIKIT